MQKVNLPIFLTIGLILLIISSFVILNRNQSLRNSDVSNSLQNQEPGFQEDLQQPEGDHLEYEEPAAENSPARIRIDIKDSLFNPSIQEIKAGSTVIFENKDEGSIYTITSDDGTTFDTGDIGYMQKKEIILDKPGKYNYSCKHHPEMKGTIVVVE